MLTNCAEELPNPHTSCVREILDALVCHDHDFRRLTIELRNMNMEFKREVDNIEFRCRELRRPVCPGDEKIPMFTQQILTIDEVTMCFNEKIAALKENRNEIASAARQCLMQLSGEKCKFKRFHENTIDHLKRVAINTDDATVIKNCEKDICEMHKGFVKEVAFIKKCEQELQPFLEQLKNQEFLNYRQCCCFKDYEWLPQGKNFQVVAEKADNIKDTMGATLREAFAQLHVHQPADIRSFLAAYLINIEKNEEMLKEKLELFGTI